MIAAQRPALYHGGDAPISRAADRVMLAIPAGRYVAGSTPEEREQAYQDYRDTAGHDAARAGRWFNSEADRHLETSASYHIDLTPVTNGAYAEFLRDTNARPPRVDPATWAAQGFQQDFESEVDRFNWTSSSPPVGREEHPVVLVTWEEADRYCQWRGALVGEARRLPTEGELERAARGDHGVIYPWGNTFEPDRLNSRVSGPGDTTPVGSYPRGASPHHMLDAAGNVFSWSSTPWRSRPGQRVVKGSAWDDFAGVGRGASRHGRPVSIRHAIIGFRCAG